MSPMKSARLIVFNIAGVSLLQHLQLRRIISVEQPRPPFSFSSTCHLWTILAELLQKRLRRRAAHNEKDFITAIQVFLIHPIAQFRESQSSIKPNISKYDILKDFNILLFPRVF